MNIWFSSGENPELSNLALRPFTFEGKDYVSVEHAYQTLKGFAFDEKVYNAYPKGAGVKIVGSNKPYTKGNWNLQLMETLIRESFIQNPKALRILQATGESVLTHYQDNGIWKKEFPRILMKVRDELKNLGVFEPVKFMVEAFRLWFLKNFEDQYSLPQDSDSWIDSWFEWKKVEGIETFLPYMFYALWLPSSFWEVYKEKGNLPFWDIDRLSSEREGPVGGTWDWSESELDQPKWSSGSYTLEEFCLRVCRGWQDNKYSEEALNPEYWVKSFLYSKEEARSLIQYMTTNYPQPQLSPNLPAPIPAHALPEPHKFISTPISQAIPGVLGISDTPWK